MLAELSAESFGDVAPAFLLPLHDVAVGCACPGVVLDIREGQPRPPSD